MNEMSTPALPLADQRVDYSKDVLLEDASLPASPTVLLQAWLEQAFAAGEPDANAMTLATVGSDLRPSTRVVLLKGLDEQGLTWFTNYESRKAIELAGNPYAALQFHWANMQRVVRVEGVVEKTSVQESQAYYKSRPLDSRIGAWASPQSRPLASRAALEQRFETARQTLANPTDPDCPPHWGGYRLKPQHWEFWQGRSNRLHDRLCFMSDSTSPSGWRIQRLAP